MGTQRRHSMAVFLDIEKAFDNVDRVAVRKVLRGYGFGDTAIALIENFWEDEVVMRFPDGTYGECFKVTKGSETRMRHIPNNFHPLPRNGVKRHH